MNSFDISDTLIENFKAGHQSIVGALERIQSTARSYSAAKPNIRHTQGLLLNHLGKQNDELFEALRLFYRSEKHTLKMIEFLVHDLKDVKVKFLVFFDKYSGEMGDLGSPAFPKDFMEFSREILARIKVEKEYLLPMLENYLYR